MNSEQIKYFIAKLSPESESVDPEDFYAELESYLKKNVAHLAGTDKTSDQLAMLKIGQILRAQPEMIRRLRLLDAKN